MMLMKPSHKYDDIIQLDRPLIPGRGRMSAHDRAAQFSPFSALTGYEAAIEETARLTTSRAELDEDEKELINLRLLRLASMLPDSPPVSIRYFRPDEKKSGGAYMDVISPVRKICPVTGVLQLSSGLEIAIEDIFSLEIIEPEK